MWSRERMEVIFVMTPKLLFYEIPWKLYLIYNTVASHLLHFQQQKYWIKLDKEMMSGLLWSLEIETLEAERDLVMVHPPG